MLHVPRHAQDLLDRRLAGERLQHPVLLHRAHSRGEGGPMDLAGLGPGDHQTSDLVRHGQDFDDGGLPAVAAMTMLAADRPIELGVLTDIDDELHAGDDFRDGGIGLAAMAELAHQALRHDAAEGRGDEVVLDLHVEQAGDRARSAVRVERRENEMAGECRLNGNLRGFEIAHLADHDDVRIVPKKRAQNVGEGQVDLRLDLDLIDALELILDRLLDGEYLLFRGVEAKQTRIERRRLAASRRAGDEEDALRPVEEIEKDLERVRPEPKDSEILDEVGAVEDAHRHALAVERRDGGDAQIIVLPADGDPDAAVLRQAALGDVELRHDLDARDDGGAQPGRRRRALTQEAVDPVANDEAVVEGFDMDVGRTAFDAARDQEIDETDDRGLARQVAQTVDVLVGDVVVGLADLCDDLTHRALAVFIKALEGDFNVGRCRDANQDRFSGDDPDGLDWIGVERVGHRQHDAFGRIGEGDDAGLLEELGADAVEDRRIGVVGGGCDGKTELESHRL